MSSHEAGGCSSTLSTSPVLIQSPRMLGPLAVAVHRTGSSHAIISPTGNSDIEVLDTQSVFHLEIVFEFKSQHSTDSPSFSSLEVPRRVGTHGFPLIFEFVVRHFP